MFDVHQFRKRLSELKVGYGNVITFHADETTLYYAQLPDQTLELGHEAKVERSEKTEKY